MTCEKWVDHAGLICTFLHLKICNRFVLPSNKLQLASWTPCSSNWSKTVMPHYVNDTFFFSWQQNDRATHRCEIGQNTARIGEPGWGVIWVQVKPLWLHTVGKTIDFSTSLLFHWSWKSYWFRKFTENHQFLVKFTKNLPICTVEGCDVKFDINSRILWIRLVRQAMAALNWIPIFRGHGAEWSKKFVLKDNPEH